MKRTERRHLKQDELTTQLLHARELVEARKREVTAAVIAVAVVGLAALIYFGWRSHVNGRSETLLAEAQAVEDARVVPPGGTTNAPAAGPTYPSDAARDEAALGRFKAAADAYPSTEAGLFARYRQASILMALNRSGEAMVAYEDLIRRGGDGIYGQMGRLGLAEAQVRTGQFGPAIATLKDLARRKDGPLPVDGILAQLGRAYRDAGQVSEAQATFNRLLEEYPESPFSDEARRQLDEMKKT
jgi:TolA-binding protein